MAEHDPIKFATSLNSKLAARSRHVCTFLGAGASRACGLPDVSELQNRVLESLDSKQRDAFSTQLQNRNLEEGLSRLRRIAALISNDQVLDGLTGQQASELDKAVCSSIVKELDISAANLEPMDRFASWVGRSSYKLPLEVFTVNYDLLRNII